MADNIYKLKKSIGLLVDLKHLNLTDNDIFQLVEESKNSNLLNNPVDIGDDDLLKMYTTFK